MKTALSTSLQSEQKAVEERFARAETVLAARSVGAEPIVPVVETPRPTPPALAVPKVVRDSFTMPEADYALIGELRARLLRCGVASTKAEMLRAGLQLLAALSEEELQEAVAGLAKVRTGRPAFRG